MCLYAKRLEKAKFCWPRIGHNRAQLNHAQLLALVDGMDWKRVRSVPVKRPQSVGYPNKGRKFRAKYALIGIMTPPDLTLPDDIDALKAMVLAMVEKAARAEALEAENADLKALNATAAERIARLTSILKALERARFGKRSEKLDSDAAGDEQQAFVFDEIETGIAAIQAQLDKARGFDKVKRTPRPRKAFAPHLERIEVVIEPDKLAEHEGK